MISTVVTTSTVSTVTATAITSSLALIGIIVVLVLLIQKDVTSAANDKKLNRLSVALNIALPPMLIAFVMVVISKIAGIIR